MIKLAPSILSSDFARLGRELDILSKAGADYVHLDVMDGHFVPNITIGPPVIRSLRPQCGLVFDVHLMISRPMDFIDSFALAGADIITFHLESASDTREVRDIITKIKSAGKKVGIALRPGTDIQCAYEFVQYVDMVLIMSVNPGFGGQEFIAASLDKARRLRQYLDSLGLNADIEMDGGINLANVREVLNAGVNVVVVGSAIFDRGDICAATSEYLKIFEERK